MKRHKDAPETVLISVTISKPQQEMLNMQVKDGYAFNQSDAIRQAISARFKQTHPYYKQKAERQESDKARIAAQTPEEYLADEFADFNYTIKGDTVYFKHGTLPDSPGEATMPLANIKTIDADYTPLAFSRKYTSVSD